MSRTAGQVLGLTYYTGTGTANQQRLKTILNTIPGGSAISQFDYGYTVDGQINAWTNQVDGNSSTLGYYTLNYDSANQLLSAVQTNGTPPALTNEIDYTYDGSGNRLSDYALKPSGIAYTFQYNNLNELTTATGGERDVFSGTASDPTTPVTVNVAGTPAVMNESGFTSYGIASSDSSIVSVVARDGAGNRATNRYQVNNITSSGVNKSYAYDLNGNLMAVVSGGTTYSYEWDAANRMVAAERTLDG